MTRCGTRKSHSRGWAMNCLAWQELAKKIVCGVAIVVIALFFVNVVAPWLTHPVVMYVTVTPAILP